MFKFAFKIDSLFLPFYHEESLLNMRLGQWGWSEADAEAFQPPVAVPASDWSLASDTGLWLAEAGAG